MEESALGSSAGRARIRLGLDDDFTILEQRRLRAPERLPSAAAELDVPLATLLRAERERNRALSEALARAEAAVTELLAEKAALVGYYDELLARVQEMGELERRSAELDLEKLRKAQQLRALHDGLERARLEGSERGSTRALLRGSEPPRNSSTPKLLSLAGQSGARAPPARQPSGRQDEYARP